MAFLSALVTVIVPVLMVAGVGFWLGRTTRVDPGVISRLGLHALTPALILQTLLTIRAETADAGRLLLAFTALTLLGALLGWLLTWGQRPATRRASAVTVAIGNNGNMGLPVALFALGRAGVDQAVLLMVTSVLLTFLIAPLLFGENASLRQSVLRIGRMPAIWAVVLGLGMRGLSLELPTGVMRGVGLLADACVPMVLLALGIQLAATGRVRLTRAVALATAGRVVVLPVLALGIGLACGLSGLGLQSLVLAAAMPSAVNAYLLAHEYEADVVTVAHTVTLTTVLSFVTLAAVTALLPAIGALA